MWEASSTQQLPHEEPRSPSQHEPSRLESLGLDTMDVLTLKGRVYIYIRERLTPKSIHARTTSQVIGKWLVACYTSVHRIVFTYRLSTLCPKYYGVRMLSYADRFYKECSGQMQVQACNWFTVATWLLVRKWPGAISIFILIILAKARIWIWSQRMHH
jgi:hypothetical protein